ncbi:hypothetical protein EVAR_101953_1 [Eumeta japonica]|uniref:Uncharacterized protein n=1 Tax=Eumeta variegata TaxID=151549 RepID=A0A4C1TSE7_EUMVA|nr:hypothetical protein EVAR_101953_1 [Eumeta japonica]
MLSDGHGQPISHNTPFCLSVDLVGGYASFMSLDRCFDCRGAGPARARTCVLRVYAGRAGAGRRGGGSVSFPRFPPHAERPCRLFWLGL